MVDLRNRFSGCIAVLLSSVAPALSEPLWGYIDTKGHWAIPPQFSEASTFAHGRATVKKIVNGKCEEFEIDKNGKIAPAVDKLFEKIKSATNSAHYRLTHATEYKVVVDCTTSKFHFEDQTGNKVIKCEFDYATRFSRDGIAFVKDVGNKRFKMIDRTGKCLGWLNPVIESISGYFTDGLTKVQSRGQKTGFINTSGKLIIKPKVFYPSPHEFCEGLCAAGLKNRRWVYVDKRGKRVIRLPSNTNFAYPFYDGFASVAVGGIPHDQQGAEPWHDAHFALIDKLGKFVTQPSYQSIGYVHREPILVCSKIGRLQKYGYIDKHGREIIPPQFSLAEEFSEGLASVCVGGDYFDSARFQNANTSSNTPPFAKERKSQMRKFFEQYNVIGMPRAEVLQLLGKPDCSEDSKSEPTLGNLTDDYTLVLAPCMASSYGLEIQYKKDLLMRYRISNCSSPGPWIYDGRVPPMEMEFVRMPKDRIDPTHGILGVQLGWNRTGVYFYDVIGRLPAEKSGIKKGDQLLAIDGKTVAESDLREVRASLEGKPETTVTLTILRGAQKRSMTVKRLWVGSVSDLGWQTYYLQDVRRDLI